MTEHQEVVAACVYEQEMWEHYESGRLNEALEIASKLTFEFKTDDAAWYAVSQLLYKMRRFDSASAAISNAVKLKRTARNLLQETNVLVSQGKLGEGIKRLDELNLDSLCSVYQLDTAARLCASLNRFEDSKALYQRAMAIAPNDADIAYNFATVCRFLGATNEAKSALDQAKKLRPNFTEAMLLDSGLRTKTDADNQIADLERALSSMKLSPKQRVEAGYALFKELEDLERYDEASPVLFSAATLRRTHMAYSVENDIKVMERLKKVFNGVVFAEPSDNEYAPVFIVGLPRTGSTLIERLVAQSPELTSVGESDAFPLALERSIPNKTKSKFELIDQVAEADWNKLAEYYQGRISGGSQRSLDKLPMNYLNVGAIVNAFPNAKILVTDRSPLDTIYAIYKTLFEDAYPFSYDLAELAKYFVSYQSLMAHWQATYPNNVMTVRYELLIDDAESIMRRVCEFLEVGYNDNMTNPANNREASTTASATQVRQPIHSRSVGSWKRMEKDLQVCVRILADAGINVSELS